MGSSASGRCSLAFSSQPLAQTSSKARTAEQVAPGRRQRRCSDPVHVCPGTRWTSIRREAEQRDDAVDVDEEQWFVHDVRGFCRRAAPGVGGGDPLACPTRPVKLGVALADEWVPSASPSAPSQHFSDLRMTLQLGILLALLCAFASNLGFFFKHRGCNEAPRSTSATRSGRQRPVVLQVVRHRHGRAAPAGCCTSPPSRSRRSPSSRSSSPAASS